MGEVYRAHDPRLNRDVAIKVSSAQFSERFTREVRAVAALNHPHIRQPFENRYVLICRAASWYMDGYNHQRALNSRERVGRVFRNQNIIPFCNAPGGSPFELRAR